MLSIHLKTGWLSVAFAVAVALFPVRLHAQQAAELVGAVLDPSGAVVAGATVTLTHQAMGVSRKVSTNAVGTYRAAPLEPGSYQAEVSAAGFNTLVQSGIVLQVNQVARIDFSLQLGEVATVTTVVGTPPIVASENSTVGQVIDNKKIIELPMNGRNYLDLARLTPGVSQIVGPAGGVNVNGAGSQSGSLMQLDGVDNQELGFGRPNILPSLDMIQEFKIQSAQYDATQGRASMGQINVVSKSGSNEFHGSLYEFHRNASVTALNFFDQSPEERAEAGLSERPPFIRNQYGLSVGGPIAQNKTFFFFNWEATKIRQVSRGILTVPDASLSNGDFSARGQTIHDPLDLNTSTNTRGQFPDNQIPESRIDPVARNYMSFEPAPNGPGQFNNFNSTIGARDDINQYTGRVDHHWTDNDITTGRYTWNKRNSLVPGFLGSVLFPGFGEIQDFPAQNASLRHTRLVNPTTVWEVLLGYNRFFQIRVHEHDGQDIASQLGLAEQSGLPAGQRSGGFPALQVTGFAVPYEHPNAPVRQSQDHYQAGTKLSHELTNHSLKLGAEYSYNRAPLHFHSGFDRGRYQFTPRYSTSAPLGSGGPENAFADFLLGFPSLTDRGIGFPDNITNSNWWSLYVHDDWRAHRNLTLNFGLRYEMYSGVYERFDRFNTFCLDIVSYCPVATGGVPPTGYSRDWNDLAPRFGFAWRMFGSNKTVLRGGYGIFYDYVVANRFFNMNASPPRQFQDPRPGDPDLPNLSFQEPFPGPIPDAPTAADQVAGNAPARDLHTGYVQQWSLGIQHEIFPNTVLDVAYVANRGIGTVNSYNLSYVTPGLGPVAPRRLFPRISNLAYASNTGQSWYDSLQVRAERRFSQGFNFIAAYTWAKSNANGCVAGSQNECEGFRNPTDFGLDKGSGPTDIRHRLVVSTVFELPFGRGKLYGSNISKGLDAVIGGWQISAIATFQAGSRLTPSLRFNNSNAGANRPDQIGDPMEGAARTLDHWFNENAFTDPPTLAEVLDSGSDPWRSIGNAGQGSIVGPGLNTWDLGIMKRFPMPWEGHTLQFRTELFNAWNHPNFGNPNTAIPFIQGNTGVITSTAIPNRVVQFGLRYAF